jgi:hypothetical protein
MIKRTGPAPYKMSTCTFWEHGRCKKAQNCTFRHGNDDMFIDNKCVKIVPFKKTENKIKESTKKQTKTKQVWVVKKK